MTKHWILQYRKIILIAYIIVTLVAIAALFQIKFTFKFEQFFPKGDPDLAFFQEFIKDFETDDNFMLVGITSPNGIFDRQFLDETRRFSEACKELPYVHYAQSLATLKRPKISLIGLVGQESIIDDSTPATLKRDSIAIMTNPKLRDNLISKDGKSLLLILKHKDNLGMSESADLMRTFSSLVEQYQFKDYHLLGRAYFQDRLSKMQAREIAVSTIVSIILVSIIFYLLYRQKWLIAISLTTIALSMLLFVGGLSLFGREFNGISALYPVLMLIVGTSDVVHIMSKYVDQMLAGKSKSESLHVTISEIGLATFLTSITTAAGFMSLITSRIGPIQEFGVNSAIGVVLAYVVVITFTLAALTFVPREQITQTKFQGFWTKMMRYCYQISRDREKQIIVVSGILLLVFAFGISRISTNYNIESNLPRNSKITKDFRFFESQFSGFRPFEFAVTVKDGKTAYDPAVIQTVDNIVQHLKTYEEVGAINAISELYRNTLESVQSINQGEPLNDSLIIRLQPMIKNLANVSGAVLVSKDEDKTRITSKITDEGADNVSAIGKQIDDWVAANVDTTLVDIKRTGTGVILDKNAQYVRVSLLQGMLLALGIVVIIMTLLFKNIKMLFIALLPNVIPLLFAAALLGYASIELEATISIIFTIVFGIAVDDTIHFLSKYKIARNKGLTTEQAIEVTFMDTGKAITFTTIILFFGFLVLLFSIHPPSNVIGMLISVTLVSALIADFFILPLLLRRMG